MRSPWSNLCAESFVIAFADFVRWGSSTKASYTKAVSAMDFANTPMLSKVLLSGATPCVFTKPTVNLKPVIPQYAAGSLTDPPVSVPMDSGTSPPATAAAEPLLEPPGTRCTWWSHGLRGMPICSLVPQPPRANCTIWVLPMMMAPAALSLWVKWASDFAMLLANMGEPIVVTLPSISTKSFTAIGRPWSGPNEYPAFRIWSDALAASKASFSYTSTKQCNQVS